MTHLHVEGLRKQYKEVIAVDDVSLRADKGEFIVLLGPSGCGKTTTLRMIAGFVSPSGGRVMLGDRNITHLPAYRRDTGMVFQSYALFPHMTVAENVAFGLQTRKVNRVDQQSKVENVLALVQLGHLADRYPKQLSGGQQQRVALARAVVINPSLLLLDEPLSNLDAKMRGELRAEIRLLQRKLGLTTIMVTHDQDEALSMADRVIVMNHGKIWQIGTPMEIYEAPENAFIASFIGKYNLLNGTVQKPGLFKTATGQEYPYNDGSVPCGTAGVLAIRPDRVRLGKQFPGGVNIKGRVISTSYVGAQMECVLDVAGQRMTAVQPTSDVYHLVGGGASVEDIDVSWETCDARVVRI